jgi:hypothetical protein
LVANLGASRADEINQTRRIEDMYLFVNIAHERRVLDTETRTFVEWDPAYPFDGRGRSGNTWRFTSAARESVECVELNRDRLIGWDPATNRPIMDGRRSSGNYAADGCPVPAPYKVPEPVKPAVTPDDNARARRRAGDEQRRRIR